MILDKKMVVFIIATYFEAVQRKMVASRFLINKGKYKISKG